MCHAVAGVGFARTLTDLARERERLLAHAPHFGHTCLNRDQRSAEIRVSTQQQRRQAGNQPLPVVHLLEEFYDLPVIGRALHRIATERAYHAQQIQRLSDSTWQRSASSGCSTFVCQLPRRLRLWASSFGSASLRARSMAWRKYAPVC